MSSKFNNKTLLIVVAVLILLFVFFRFYKSAKNESTLKTDIVQIDTAKVSKVLLYPTSQKRKEIIFLKEGKNWKVSDGKITTEIERNRITNLLNQLQEIKSKGLISRTKDKWVEYQVSDTSGTCIKVFEGDKLKLDLIIGKFTYQKSDNPYANYGGSRVSGTSYVRLADEKEIYAVDGFLTFTFNQPFNSWRNQSLVKLSKRDITKFTFNYPSDSSFTISKQDKKWMLNSQIADSTKIETYLNSLSYKNASSFDDSYIPTDSPFCQLTLEGNNMSTLTVSAYLKDKNQFELNSSINSKAWFSSDNKGVFKDVFKGKKDFLETKKKK